MIKYAITRDTQIPNSHHIRLLVIAYWVAFVLRKSNLAKVKALAETFNHYVTLIENS